MSEVSLLVVEDDRGLAEALEDTLLLAGYKCFMVESSEDAIVALKRQNFDMVVSDVNLPEWMATVCFSMLWSIFLNYR